MPCYTFGGKDDRDGDVGEEAINEDVPGVVMVVDLVVSVVDQYGIRHT